MLSHKSSTRSRFKIFFKVKGGVFVRENKVTEKFHRSYIFRCRYRTVVMSFISFPQILSATDIWFSIIAYQNIDIPHSESGLCPPKVAYPK